MKLARRAAGPPLGQQPAVFSFLYLKKIKFQKYMSVLENFKNIPRSPYEGATGLKCNFFSSNLQRSPWRKKTSPVARWGGDRGLSPGPRATAAGPGPQSRQGACRPPRATGPPVAPPWATGVSPLIKAPALPFPPHLSPKIPPKIQKKKRGVRRRKAAKPCRIQHL